MCFTRAVTRLETRFSAVVRGVRLAGATPRCRMRDGFKGREENPIFHDTNSFLKEIKSLLHHSESINERETI